MRFVEINWKCGWKFDQKKYTFDEKDFSIENLTKVVKRIFENKERV